ncbi:hypothetical protein [Clostridium oceanicum]
MYDEQNQDEFIEKYLKLQKRLSLINLIITTIICIGPAGWLIIRILDKKIDKLMITAILTIPTLIYMTWTWCSYFYSKKVHNLEKEIDVLKKNINILQNSKMNLSKVDK